MPSDCTHCHTEKHTYQEWGLLAAGALLLIGGVLWPVHWLKLILFIAAYLCCGVEVLLTSFHNVRRGEVFDENFLMTLATVGAFAIGEYPEGVSVMLFYQIGEKLQAYASGSSRRKIAALVDLRPPFARLVAPDGTEISTSPTHIQVGQTVRMRAGERVPLDGVLLRGNGQVDMSALTGESRPVVVQAGAEVLAGSLSINSVLDIQVTKLYAKSAVAQILELAEHAARKKSTTEKFITRFARIYTPVVVEIAFLVAIVPPLVYGANLHDWVYRALIFLVISCPCALVLSVPLGFFGGIGGAAHSGILIKGSSYLERLARIGTVCLDKTGTLTQGVFQVLRVVPAGKMSADDLLTLAASLEVHSNHPIAQAIVKAAQPSVQAVDGGKIQELPGEGMLSNTLAVGNAALLRRVGITDLPATPGTVVHMAQNGQYVGHLELGDPLKPTALPAVQQLQHGRAQQVALVSGDNPATVEHVARELGISAVFGGLLPAGKMQVVEDFIRREPAGYSTIFVGDGINDAPVLKRADVGVAVGGSDAALEAADVVLLGEGPLHLVQAVDISRFTLHVIRQNMVFALGVKVLVLGLGIAGLANMWMAVFADVGVSLLAVLNSLRPLYYNGMHDVRLK